MKKSTFLFTLLLIAELLLSADLFSNNERVLNIIPYPQKIEIKDGNFSFGKKINVVFDGNDKQIKTLVQQFATQINLVSGVKVVLNGNAKKMSTISFVKLTDQPAESYTLSITSKKIMIGAGDANGMFYAIQTIYQLLPVEIYAHKKADVKIWELPCVDISDTPRFSYRGLHLDVCRHFFPVEFIKKYIDAMAIHKLNRFHWHLTDDQGWRIEIKKYPLLTQIGSQRPNTLIGHFYENFPQRFDNKSYGGFYTQEQAREIVAYAAERFITVIPEIEMPGHAMAAIAAYPYLSCTRQKIEPANKWGIFDDVFCPRDSTFEFMQNVLTEVMTIFPSQYIHIGGDECPKTRWKTCADCQNRIKTLGLKDEHELQSYFVQRIEKFVNAKGRKIIGWDEILEGGLAPNATVMSWRGTEGGIAAARSGHDVIMTPVSHCYFDFYQAEPVYEPTAIGGLTTFEKVYSFEPVPAELNNDQAKHILGAQANLWTEYIETTDHVEYMIFPRISAMSEVLWTNAENKNWHRFTQNMNKEYRRYDMLKINAAKAFYNINAEVKTLSDNNLEILLKSDNPNAEIRFTIDGTNPDEKSGVYKNALRLTQTATIKAQAFENGAKVGREFNRQFVVSKTTGLAYNKNFVSGWYKGGSEYALTDGVLGNSKTTNEWTALIGSADRELLFDLGRNIQLKYISVGMLSVPAMRALFAPEIVISVSENGVDFQKIASESIQPSANDNWKIYRPEFKFPPTNARYIKFNFKNAGDFSGIHGPGSSFLFLDEIQVK